MGSNAIRVLPLLLLSAVTLGACATETDDGVTGDEDDLTEHSDIIFSPAPPEATHLLRLAKEIDAAKKTVDVAIYSYGDAGISDALARAVTRGVKVRFIYDQGSADAHLAASSQPSSTSGKLEAAGVNVRYVSKIMHHKFLIVDGPRDDLALAKTAHLVTGSANWNASAAKTFDENTIIFQKQPELVLRFQRDFDTMWAHSKDFVGKDMPYELSTSMIPDSAIPDTAHTNAIFTSSNFKVKDTTFSVLPTSNVADALVAGINAATKSIHMASTHLRSRPVAEALIAKKKALPTLDVRVYLDGQEYIAKGTNDIQVANLERCTTAAGTSEAKKADCLANNYLFSYDVGAAGIDLRFKYYAYRWDASYAPQMHHKFMVVDGARLFSGSYNLSDNSEHGTFENELLLEAPTHAKLIAAFEANFESIWKTGRDESRLATLDTKIDQGGSFPIVFDPMALSNAEVTTLKDKIRTKCPAVDTAPFREAATSHRACAQ